MGYGVTRHEVYERHERHWEYYTIEYYDTYDNNDSGFFCLGTVSGVADPWIQGKYA